MRGKRLIWLIVFAVPILLSLFLTSKPVQSAQSIRLPFPSMYLYNASSNSFVEDRVRITDACQDGQGNNGTHFEHTGQARFAVDFGVPSGTPIYAPIGGEVIFAGVKGGYGNLVIVEESSGRQHWLAHNSFLYVKQGDSVIQLKLIALSGNTGTPDPHLHYHVIDSNGVADDVRDEFPITDIEWIDPSDYCAGVSPGSIDGTAHASTHPNGIDAKNCSEFYDENRPGVWGFDAPNCQGNVVFGALTVGDYDLAGSAFQGNDRTRSISKNDDNLNFWLYGHNDSDDLKHCHDRDMWDTDIDYYNNSGTHIGYDDSAAWKFNGWNMVSRIVVTTDDCPSDQEQVQSSVIIRDDIGIPVASGDTVTLSENIDFGGTQYGGHDEISFDLPDYMQGSASAVGMVDNWSVIAYSGLGQTGDSTCFIENDSDFTDNFYSNGTPVNDSIYSVTLMNTELCDISPPETTLTLNGTEGNNGWHVSNVNGVLTATDDDGVASTKYQINGGATVEANSFTLTDDGIYNIIYWSVDVYGNVESAKSIEVFIDQTPPVTTGSATGPRDTNGTFRADTSVSIVGFDETSGPDFAETSYDNGVTWQVMTETDFVIVGNGITQFYTRYTDLAGNVGAHLDSGPIIINQYVIFSAANDFVMKSNTGSDITGDVYSGSSAYIGSNTGTDLHGTMQIVSSTYTWELNAGVDFDAIETSVPTVEKLSYPLSYYWNQCDQVYDNGLTLYDVGQEMSGIVCVTGNLVSYAVGVYGDVTFIVNGDIYFGPTCGWYYTNDPDNGMIMYATGDITLAGNCYDIMGLVLADGNIFYESTNTLINGSLVADQVEVRYSTGVELTYDAAFSNDTFDLPVSNVSFADPSVENQPNPTPQPTTEATSLPTATATIVPTNTPLPTGTPLPTNTPVPTNTPLPTATALPTNTPVATGVVAPCSNCEYYTGALSGADDYEYQPDGTYYYSDSFGYQEGWLEGVSGTDYDLHLQRWFGNSWFTVMISNSNGSSEHINYFGSPGYYVWLIYSDDGSGNYDFWLEN